MEKKIIKYNFLLILSFSSFLFFWDLSIASIQVRFLILIPLIFFPFFNFNQSEIAISKFIIFVIIFIHLIYNVNDNLNFFYFFSFLFLFFISFIVFFFKNYILIHFEKFVYFFLLILIISIINFCYANFQLIDYNYLGNFFQLSRLIFKENSHLGMVVPSIIIFFIYKYSIKKNYKYLWTIIFAFTIIFFAYSLTAYVGLILSSLILLITNYSVIKKKLLYYLLILIILCSLQILTRSEEYKKFVNSVYSLTNAISINTIITNNDIEIKTEKKIFNKNFAKKRNLSIEVYITSLKIAFYAIKDKPFGHGLNNYHTAFSKYINLIDVQNIIAKNLNKQDASINFSKIITEFGIFSIFFVFVVFKFIFSKKIDLSYKFLLVPNLFTQTFLRGAGYFNGGYILFLLILIFIVYETEFKKNN